jgi:hypothetical protein
LTDVSNRHNLVLTLIEIGADMEKDYSAKAFFEFMDYLSAKGLLKPNTAASRKAAGNKMLDILDDSEKQDLRKVDVDALHERFSNLSGTTYSPKSLQVYKSRFKKARQDFIKFVDNPSGFKPTVTQRDSSGGGNNAGKRPKPKAKTTTAPEPQSQSSGFREPLVIPVPIRPDVTVEIRNVPDDLSEAEATRIAAIVQAYGQK